MLKFSGHKTFEQIQAQCLAQGVPMDCRVYDAGGDTVMVGRGQDPATAANGWVIYNVVNGRFFGTTPDGVAFSSDSAEHDAAPWMQGLLNFFMVGPLDTRE